ncbi:ATP-dependent exoDNAse (exonuclease V) alpha subunit-helicase superfamily I member [Sphingobacterium sp. JB170]|nr:ATP-dependent exoDNAse (exonuclease V) alpha subunit-helicase superfamily I member [Sphingobacterium sp. JB170]
MRLAVQNDMRYFSLVLIFILGASLAGFAQTLPYLPNPTYQDGEKLTYKLKYGIISAATGTLKIENSKLRFSNPNAFHLSAFGETSGAFSVFYTVKNQYDSYIDGDTYLPYLYTEDIHEGSYTRSEYATFDHRNKKVSGRKGTFTSPNNQFFDLLSAYYFSRNLDLSSLVKGDKFKLTYFLNDEVDQLGVEYIGVEKIKTSLGTIECIKLSPEISPGRIFKKDSRLYLWVTNDGNRIPVKAQVEIIIGSVTMELVSASGLKYPLGKRVSYSK